MEVLYNIAQVSNLQTLSQLYLKSWKNLCCSGDPHLFIPANIGNSFPTFLIIILSSIYLMFQVFSRSTKISSHKTKNNNKSVQITENGLKIKLIQWLVFMPPLPIIWHCDSSNINLPELTPLNFLTKMVSDFFNFTNK